MEWRGPFAVRPQQTDPNPLRADTPVFTPPEYAVPQSAYAVPPLSEGSPYNDEFGWSAELRTSPTGVPSAQRLDTIPRYGEEPPDQNVVPYWQKRDADARSRHSVEKVNPTGWHERRGVFPTDLRWVDNPRRKPPVEQRMTSDMAPTTYSFMRPFDQHSARTFNGMHFSMADHRRDYEILGMEPVRSRRNTYRIEPQPWDIDIVDLPPEREPATPQARMRSTEVPQGSRSFRLV